MGDTEPAKELSSSAKNMQQAGCGDVRRWTERRVSKDEWMDPPVRDVLHNLQDFLMNWQETSQRDGSATSPSINNLFIEHNWGEIQTSRGLMGSLWVNAQISCLSLIHEITPQLMPR